MQNRIMIVGCCGSGKSTLARRIAKITRLPLIHLDHEYFKPNWVEPSKEEWENKIKELCLKQQWIIDGNYISSMEIRAEEADCIIFLDMNRFKCLYRAVMRATRPSKRHRSDMGDGCSERHELEFYKFIWNFNKTTRPRVIKLLEQYNEKKIIVLRSRGDVKRFLNSTFLLRDE